MDLRIAGRNAIVTGASLGIGRAVATELARAGVNVAIAARDAQRLDDAARAIATDTGARIVPIACDTSQPEQIDRLVAQAREALGAIDILVNNAGASPAGRIAELTDEQWRMAFELKLMGYVRCARAVLPQMRERRWGRIVNVAGRAAGLPTPGYLLGGFNAALVHFTHALAPEAARDQVLVNVVNPGATNTPRFRTLVAYRAKASGRPDAEVAADWNRQVAVGRIAEPEDVADLVAFLCSERARHIAGASIDIDGGGAGGV